MKRCAAVVVALITLGLSGVAQAQTKATPVLTKDLPDLAGKEVAISKIVYPPGFSSPAHRHDANTFVYVLEGTMIMSVGGGQSVTLGPGQTFYESPSDVHAVSKNASATEPATILVFMIKDKGKPASRPAN